MFAGVALLFAIRELINQSGAFTANMQAVVSGAVLIAVVVVRTVLSRSRFSRSSLSRTSPVRRP